jgi:hypothetical protein
MIGRYESAGTAAMGDAAKPESAMPLAANE